MEITTQGKKDQEAARGRLRNARILADKIKQMCEADLACRRLAPAWKLVTIVLNNALSFDSCVVPPEAIASYAQEIDELVDALLPLFAGQHRFEPVSIKRMRLPRKFGGFDVTPMYLRSPMAFLAQILAIAPSVARTTGVQPMEMLGLIEAARNAQDRPRHLGLSIDENAMPRERGSPSQELNVTQLGSSTMRNRQVS